MISGCTGPTIDPEPLEAETVPPVRTEVATPKSILWDGHIRTVACVPAGIGQCVGVASGTTNDMYRHTLSGKPNSLNFSLEWTPSSPMTQELGFSLSRVEKMDCGEGCTSWKYHTLAKGLGTSPVRIEGDPAGLAGNETLSLHVFLPRKTTDPVVYAYAHPHQPFHVEGSLRHAPPPEAP